MYGRSKHQEQDKFIIEANHKLYGIEIDYCVFSLDGNTHIDFLFIYPVLDISIRKNRDREETVFVHEFYEPFDKEPYQVEALRDDDYESLMTKEFIDKAIKKHLSVEKYKIVKQE